MKVLKEVKLNGFGGDNIWMNLVEAGDEIKLILINSSEKYGEINFEKDKELGEAIFRYLEKRFMRFNSPSILLWTRKIIKMSGGSGKLASLFLSVEGQNLSYIKMTNVVNRLGLNVREENGSILISETVDTESIGEFKVEDGGFAFNYF